MSSGTEGGATLSLEVVPFKETQVDPSSVKTTDAFRHLKVRLEEVPAEVLLGSTARYVAMLTNTSSSAVPLQPCPAYVASFGEGSVATFQRSLLNCEAAPPTVEPGRSVQFEMKMTIEGEDIGPGFEGKFHWRLASAPSNVDAGASSGPIIVRGGATSETAQPRTLADRPARDPLVTDGHILGLGRFIFESQGGRWGVFLEGPERATTFRHVAVLDSGDVVCSSAGSADGLYLESIRITTCVSGPFGLTLGHVPSDVTRVEVTLAEGSLSRAAEVQASAPADEPLVRAIALVHSSEERPVSIRGFRADGTVIDGLR